MKKRKKKKYDEESDHFYRVVAVRISFFHNLTERSESVPGIDEKRDEIPKNLSQRRGFGYN